MKKLSVLAGFLFVLSAGSGGLALAQSPAKAEATVPAPGGTVLAQSPAKTEAAAPAQEETPIIKLGEVVKDAGVKVGVGNLKLGGLIQIWFVDDPTKEFSKSKTEDSTFRLRRSEIKLSGDIIPQVGFTVMIDPAKQIKLTAQTNAVDQSTTVLQDAYVQLRFSKMFPGIDALAPQLEAQVGQQKLGITEEGTRSSAKLDMVERSQIGRLYGDKRDIGILLKDNYTYVEYNAAIFNGSGMQTADENSEKSIAAHLALKPITGVKIGGSLLGGSTGADKADQKRQGADVQLEYGAASLKAEYLHGTDNTTDFDGYYIQPGCYLVKDVLQLVARYDSYDKNLDSTKDVVKEISGALNLFLAKYNAEVQLEYMRRNNQATTDENVLLVNLQAAF